MAKHPTEDAQTAHGTSGARKGGGNKVPLVVRTLIVTEVVSLIAAFFLTLVARRVPDRGIASRFVEDPSFMVEFAISFGVANILLSGFAIAFLATRGFGTVDRRR